MKKSQKMHFRKVTNRSSWRLYLLSNIPILVGAAITAVTDSFVGLALGGSAGIMLTLPLCKELLTAVITGHQSPRDNKND